MNNIQPVWIKYGIIYGIISILITIFTYYVFSLNPWVQGVFGFTIMVFIMLLAGKEQRRLNGESMTFFEAYTTTFLTAFVGTTISALFSIILINLIDPSLVDKLTDIIVEQTQATMQSLGLPEDKIDEALEDLENNTANNFTPGMLLWGLLMSSIVLAIFAVIVSLFLKKEQPISFDEEHKLV